MSLQLTARKSLAAERGLVELDTRQQRVGVVASTDEHGAFRIVAPLCGVPDGRFEARGSQVDSIHVTVLRLGKAPYVLLPRRHQGSTERDLGGIHVVEGGTIEGDVLLPPGVDPLGLAISVDDVLAYADARGRFRIVDVPAGKHVLALRGRRGALENGAATRATVESGVTTEVVIDARCHGVCEVSLRILLNGAPAVGCLVRLHDGLALGQLDLREQVFDLTPGARIERTVSIECGDSELILPPSLALPSSMVVHLALSVDGAAPSSRELALEHGRPMGKRRGVIVDGRLRARMFVVGGYRLDVSIAESTASYQEVKLPKGGVRYRRTPSFEWHGDIEIRAGEITVVDLARQ